MSFELTFLVADDSATDRLLVGGLLRQWGHRVIEARDGLEAWDLVNREDVDVVVSDWNMPGIDGPELCRRIRSLPGDRYTYVVLLTVRQDRSSFVAGMEAGADDFLTKPIDITELELRLRPAQRILELEDEVAVRSRRLGAALERIESDLHSAAIAQRSLLPEPTMSHGLRWDWIYSPSLMLAGDMLGYGVLDEHHFAFYQIDVSGHGISSALLSFSLCHLLAARSMDGSVVKRRAPEPPYYQLVPPHEVVADLNQRFLRNGKSRSYFTMVYGIVDTSRRRLTMTQAGHPAPIRVRPDGRCESLGRAGFPVGLLPTATFTDATFELGPGDRLVFASDGVSDAQDPDGRDFGDDRFHRLLSDTAALPVDEALAEIERTLEAWAGGGEPEDDISVLAVDVAD